MVSDSSPPSLMPAITSLLHSMISSGAGHDAILNMLALLCLLQIVSRLPPPAGAVSISPSPAANPLAKLLADVSKPADGSSSGTGDLMMTLLPLLSNPQIKNKLGNANLSSLLGLVGGLASSDSKPAPPAAAAEPRPVESQSADSQRSPDLNRSLNWKSNFQSEKET